MARRGTRLLYNENSLYQFNTKTQSWIVNNSKLEKDSKDLFSTGMQAKCKHMSQKITPIKFRCGFLDTWSFTSFINYKETQNALKNDFFFELFVKNYVESILKNLNIFFDKIEIKQKEGVFYFNIFYFKPEKFMARDLYIKLSRIKMFRSSLLKLEELDVKKVQKKKKSIFFLNPFYHKQKSRYKLNIQKLADYLETKINLFFGKKVRISFYSQKNISKTANLFANFLASEIERPKANFKKALKKTFKEFKKKSKIKGIRVNCSGRLGKAPMAKTLWYKIGQIPLNTISASLKYSETTAFTRYGSIGIKVWLFHHSKNKKINQLKKNTYLFL